MNNTNLLEPRDNHDGTKINSPLGILFLLPIFIIVAVYIIIPLFGTLITSFTSYNIITRPAFIGLQNYRSILQNDNVFWMALSNTVVFSFFSVVIATGLSVFMAWGTSSLHKSLKTLLCILFSMVSAASYIIPQSLGTFLSSTHDGYLNSFLLKSGMVSRPIVFVGSPIFIRIFSVLIPVIIGLGPLYVLFTLAFQNKAKLKFFCHLAVSLQILISILSFAPAMEIVGSPSMNYIGDTLPMHIIDYMAIRFQIGYASALIVILGILILVLVALYNFLIWIVFIVMERQNKIMHNDTSTMDKRNSTLSILTFILSITLFSLLMLPFIQSFFDSFKSLNELYIFPKKLLPEHPTWQNYRYTINNLSGGRLILNTGIMFLVFTLAMMVISILSGIGFSLFQYNGRKKLLHSLTFLLVLSPLWLLSPMHMRYTNNSNQVFLLFQSPAFGLVICFGAMIMKASSRGFSSIKDFISSGKAVASVGIKMLAISMLASLSLWINIGYTPYNREQWTLANLARQASDMQCGATLLVISMILPIIIILVCVPMISNITYSKKEQDI